MTTLLYKKFDSKIQYVNTGYGECQTLNILSFNKKDSKGLICQKNSIKEFRVRITYTICDNIHLIYRHVRSNSDNHFSKEEAITDSTNGFKQYNRILKTEGKRVSFTPVSIEEKELMIITMNLKKLPIEFRNDLKSIIGWIKIE